VMERPMIVRMARLQQRYDHRLRDHEFSSTSIRNQFSDYGSLFSNYSACNLSVANC